MDATEFREAVESEKGTELGRLGSNKLLIALTDANLEERPVLAAAAGSERAAKGTFEAWRDDEADDRAREAFAATVEQERDHYERVVEHLPDDYDPGEPSAMHSYLRGLDDTIPRVAAGLVGRPLVSLESHTQVISFFVNEADTAKADLFRDLKSETEGSLETGLNLLEELCDTEDDWERARGPAEYTIQVAYDEYADALRGMGVDPKPLC